MNEAEMCRNRSTKFSHCFEFDVKCAVAKCVIILQNIAIVLNVPNDFFLGLRDRAPVLSRKTQCVNHTHTLDFQNAQWPQLANRREKR